jgi:endonuclease/exonuclease/phosphatase family metal-dependent hydrolase
MRKEIIARVRRRAATGVRTKSHAGRGRRGGSSLPPYAFCLLLLALLVLLYPEGRAAGNDDPVSSSTLLEVGSAAKLIPPPAAASEIKLVSYNMRYRAGRDLEELIELLKTDAEIGGAAVIGLQECDRNKKRTGNKNTPRAMAEALGMHYAWAAPPNPSEKDGKTKDDKKEEETGVAILSPYALRDVERIVLTHEGPGRRRRAAIGATITIGGRDLRFYSVHAETRMPVAKKVDHWRAVLEDLQRRPSVKHVVVLGDFNTVKDKDARAARKLFTDAGFTTPFRDEDSTFKVLFLGYKLDWVWLRGLESVSHGIDKKIGLSDHWPLWVRAKLMD